MLLNNHNIATLEAMFFKGLNIFKGSNDYINNVIMKLQWYLILQL